MASRRPLSGAAIGALIAAVHSTVAQERGSGLAQAGQAGKRSARKVSCDDCYFRVNLLCALDLAEPCATFRPDHAQLRPPQQLRFVFRQERRTRAAWAFPSASEQAAMHA
jgi:hypothetical protein